METADPVSQERSEAEASTPRTEEGWNALDPRAVSYWRTSNLIGTGLVLFFSLVGGILLWFLTGFPKPLIPALVLAALLLLLIESLWLPGWKYRSTSYRMQPLFFELRSGILWKSSVMIPLSRVQHLDLLQGPLERNWGLATLEIHTAGTQNAKHELSGLDHDAGRELRRQLIAAADLDQQQ